MRLRLALGRRRRPLIDYNAPHYWLDYRRGFVPRGLPGALLQAGLGRPPSYDEVARAGVLLSRAAAAALVPVVVRACRPTRGPAGAVAAGVLLLSPLTVPLLLHDTGRYDAAGVLAAALVAGTPALPLPPAAATVLLSTTVAAATACEEFLLAVLAPPATMAALALGGGRGRSRRVGLVLAPAALVAAASLVVPVPEEAVAAAREAARAEGVPPAGPMGDALGALERGLVENLAFFRLFEPGAVVGSLSLWAALYGATVAVLGRLIEPPRGWRVLVTGYAGVGVGLSALGTDSRRWWGLALTGLAATLAADPRQRGVARSLRPSDAAAAAGLVAAGLAVRSLPVHPWGPVRDRDLPAT